MDCNSALVMTAPSIATVAETAAVLLLESMTAWLAACFGRQGWNYSYCNVINCQIGWYGPGMGRSLTSSGCFAGLQGLQAG